MPKKRTALIIMDGWGRGKKDASDAVFQAKTPFVDGLYNQFPHAELTTHGAAVGLPDGQMGNSEVGHLNLGAGRVVYQDLMRINKAIASDSLSTNPVFESMIQEVKTSGKKLHILGLVSDGGVHSHIEHLKAIINATDDAGLDKVYIHAFTDGRDTDPKSGRGHLSDLEAHLAHSKAQLATICGRYWAMDRDLRWERIKQAYDLLVNGKGEIESSAIDSIDKAYAAQKTDEFIAPILLDKAGLIDSGDVVFFFNYRTDRCRQLVRALTQEDFEAHQMHKLEVSCYTMTQYDANFKQVQVVFSKDALVNGLGEVLAANNLTQLRAAETEKYPHVTFFFNGGHETAYPGEERVMVNSPKVATYDLQPEMSAHELTAQVVNRLKLGNTDFLCLNYANPDMVGHTGDINAVIKAVETVDQCVQEVVHTALGMDYSVLLTADHGNAEFMKNEDGSPNTAHTTNLVPCFLIEKRSERTLSNGKLGDVAPTILELMEIDQPAEMTGKSLLV